MGIIQRLFGKKKDTSLESKVVEPMVSVQTITKPESVTISKILVIEDTPKHLADAKAYFADKPVEVVYASTYEEATKLYDSVDAVISDVYFPESEGKEAMDMGVEVALDLYGKKPFVLCTSGYHHGSKLQHVCTLARQLGWGELIDGDVSEDVDAEAKDWKSAYVCLTEQGMCAGLELYLLSLKGKMRRVDSVVDLEEGLKMAKGYITKEILKLESYSTASIKYRIEHRTGYELVKHPKLFKVLEKGEDGMYTKVELV